MKMNFINQRICLNVLAGSLENAREIYRAAGKHVVVGVLSSSYQTVEAAITDMKRYHAALEGNLSVGLGGGDPRQCQAVIDIARHVKANHFNQVFTGVGGTRVSVDNAAAHINALVSPSGTVGKVIISTGPLSSQSSMAASVDVAVAIDMVKDMGGNSLKFFPMKGLACKEELIAVARACAAKDFMLEPTGGIDPGNFEQIITLILNNGVRRCIPHVYSSIIDKQTGNTRIADVERLSSIAKRVSEAVR